MSTPTRASADASISRRARVVLFAFVVTFVTARILVLLIMTRRLPGGLFLHLGGTHVHHLNYGIYLLCVVAGVALLRTKPLAGLALRATLLVYGLALALTFDEFGMWLHLGGGYWQRASYDAIVTVAALLGLIAFAPSVRHWRLKHWAAAGVCLVCLALLAGLMLERLQRFGRSMGPWLEQIERSGPQ